MTFRLFNMLNNAPKVLISLIATVTLLSGCATTIETPPPVVETEAPIAKKTPVATKPKPIQAPPKTKLKSVAIVTSNNSKSSIEVTRRIDELVNVPVQIYKLHGNRSILPHVRTVIKNSEHESVVAIGSLAAETTAKLEDKSIVYCQVLNKAALPQSSSKYRPISMIPPAGTLTKTWKNINPNIREIVVITGDNLEDQVNIVREQVKKEGLALRHIVVDSDLAFSYQLKKLSGDTQGLWLLPDHRILSKRILSEAMSYTFKNRIQVAGFSRNLFKHGALFYVGINANDLAKTAIKQLKRMDKTNKTLFVESADIAINNDLAKSMKISIPPNLKSLLESP